MLDYISCNLRYYSTGNGKGSKKYSNIFKIVFYSVKEYLSFRKELNRPVDELALKRRSKKVRKSNNDKL
jgi:hypothetical protein